MIDTLPDEILRHVLIFMDPVQILVGIGTCNRRLAGIASSDNFWRFKYSELYSFPSSVVPGLTTKQLQQCCVTSHKRQTCRNWFAPERNEKDYYCWPGLILPTKADALQELVAGDGRYCLCTSRDRDVELLENVLVENDWEGIVSGDFQVHVNGFDNDYWSSAPSHLSDPEDTNEVILFTTNGKAIITEVAIKPLVEPFSIFGSTTVFSWPRISIQVYSLPQNGNEVFKIKKEMFQKIGSCFDTRSSSDHRLDQRAIIEAVLESHDPVYESPVIQVPSFCNAWQYHSIPDGVVGNVITFTLHGKRFEQFTGSGYYVCVERISARGVPLIYPIQR